MVLGIGTDIVEIGRVKRAIENPRFIERVFTARESAYCDGRGAQRAASYAARFAGKEAVLKAFGTGLRGGTLLDIEILPDALGCPHATLHGFYASMAYERQIKRIFLSLSHAQEYAVAQCVFEGDER